MHYKGVELDDNLRVVECPVCKNTEFSSDVEYCRICGTLLFNRCVGIVPHDNPGNARYCETCGEKTYFLKAAILEPWHKVEPEDDSSAENSDFEW